MRRLLPQLDVLFVLSEDVVFLRRMPLETFLDSDKVSASLIESALDGSEVGDSFDE
jgi:hypothetical protein